MQNNWGGKLLPIGLRWWKFTRIFPVGKIKGFSEWILNWDFSRFLFLDFSERILVWISNLMDGFDGNCWVGVAGNFEFYFLKFFLIFSSFLFSFSSFFQAFLFVSSDLSWNFPKFLSFLHDFKIGWVSQHFPYFPPTHPLIFLNFHLQFPKANISNFSQTNFNFENQLQIIFQFSAPKNFQTKRENVTINRKRDEMHPNYERKFLWKFLCLSDLKELLK